MHKVFNGTEDGKMNSTNYIIANNGKIVTIPDKFYNLIKSANNKEHEYNFGEYSYDDVVNKFCPVLEDQHNNTHKKIYETNEILDMSLKMNANKKIIEYVLKNSSLNINALYELCEKYGQLYHDLNRPFSYFLCLNKNKYPNDICNCLEILEEMIMSDKKNTIFKTELTMNDYDNISKKKCDLLLQKHENIVFYRNKISADVESSFEKILELHRWKKQFIKEKAMKIIENIESSYSDNNRRLTKKDLIFGITHTIKRDLTLFLDKL